MAANDDFVIVWQSFNEDGNNWGVFGQMFNSADAKVGGEFQVNTFTLDQQDNPSVAMDSAGDFVVAWQSFNEATGIGYDVYARRYNSAAVPERRDARQSEHDLRLEAESRRGHGRQRQLRRHLAELRTGQCGELRDLRPHVQCQRHGLHQLGRHRPGRVPHQRQHGRQPDLPGGCHGRGGRFRHGLGRRDRHRRDGQMGRL